MPAKKRQRLLALLVSLLGLAVMVGCHSSMTEEDTPGTKRDINTVLRDHDRELLARPGVVGVYVGLLGDGKTPCLKVMLARQDRELARSIPRHIEGYRVLTEVTGEIKPMDPTRQAR